MKQNEKHTCGPIYREDSKVLILGTFPSVKSREARFYYGHPQNRFWKVLPTILGEPIPNDIEEKRNLLLKHHVALWDVVAECDIVGSSDSSIKNVIPCEIRIILDAAPIQQIYVNGNKAYELYQKHIYPEVQRQCIKLPSTSPANARFRLDDLCREWMQVAETLSE